MSSSAPPAPDSSTRATPREGSALRVFLGFRPETFVEDVFNAGDDYINDAADATERKLRALVDQARGAGKIKASAVAKLHAEANQGCDKLVPKLRHVLDGATDRFEAYVLRNILTAPAGVTDAALLARAQQPMPSKTSTSAEAPDAERLAELQASVQSAQDEVRLARKRRRDLTQTVRMLRKRVPALREAADALAAGASTAVSRGTTAHGQAPQAVQDAAAQAKALHIACRQLRSASASLQPGSAAAATAADTAGGPASTSDSPTAAWRAAQGEWNAARAELSGDPSELASMGAALSGGTTSRTTS